MEEVRVGEQFLFVPHRLLDGAGDGIEALLVAGFLGEALRPLLDNGVARVGLAVDGVAEAHDDFLARQHPAHGGSGFFRGVELLDQRHRRLVRAAVQGPAQGADGAGDAGVHVRKGGSADPRSEGGGVELVLGVENQRHIHHAAEQIARRRSLQGGEEVPGDGIFVRLQLRAHAFVAVAVPVVDDGGQGAEQPIRHRLLVLEITLRFEIAEHRTARAHDVHRMGRSGNPLQDFEQRLRQAAQRLELGAVGAERFRVRKFAVEDQVRYFLERCAAGEVRDVVAAIGQAGAGLAYRAERGLARALSAQAGAAEFLVHHVVLATSVAWEPLLSPPGSMRPQRASAAQSPDSANSRSSLSS